MGALVGVFAIRTLRPEPPATTPVDRTVVIFEPTGLDSGLANRNSAMREFDDHFRFMPATADFFVHSGGVRVRCSPLLMFDRVSPDGFWSLFAPSAAQRRLSGSEIRESGLVYGYDDGARIAMETTSSLGSFRLLTETPLRTDVYSHINTYCHLQIDGHRRLSLAFAPDGKPTFTFQYAEYPTGKPMRLACRKADGKLHVLEADSGEKGPFRSLAEMEMATTDPLVITLYDRGHRWSRFGLMISPRKRPPRYRRRPVGGSPVNAIEFALSHEDPASSANVWITLAGTSVGRGWDCVGHRAGTYRNRIEIRRFDLKSLDLPAD